MDDNFNVNASSLLVSHKDSSVNAGTKTLAIGYVGWALPDGERDKLLALFPPTHPDVVAHHVTLAFGVSNTFPLPEELKGEVIGVADDRQKVQALVLEIGGTTRRPDGKVFHCTWSLDRSQGTKPVHSNDVIRSKGFQLVGRVPVKLEPRFFA